ncbi:NADH dehydrogenase (ubiquinone) 15 kDa subunit [Xylocopa sonorina]|uniref:NADH dehydrogenase (ubiquinone) 15 kDa subunit n=1 Tax=Xylocopa sonorina TaxID=1818115 RepID=UPI00403AA376
MSVPEPAPEFKAKNPNHVHLYNEPAIYSPLEHFFGTALHNQHDALCRDFEYQLALCVDAYGFYQGQLKCDLLIKDLSECLLADKRNSRREIISGEFNRQVDAGERKYEKTKFLPFL